MTQPEGTPLAKRAGNALDSLTTLLPENGWTLLEEQIFGGVEYDLVARRRMLGLVNFYFFVKAVPVLDTRTAIIWQNNWAATRESVCESKGCLGLFWAGWPAQLCLLAGQVPGGVLSSIQSGQIGPFAVYRTNHAGVSLVVADLELGHTHLWLPNNLPPLPVNVNRKLETMVKHVAQVQLL